MDYYAFGWILVFLLLVFVLFLSRRRSVVWFGLASIIAFVVNQFGYSFFIQWLWFLGIVLLGLVIQGMMSYYARRK